MMAYPVKSLLMLLSQIDERWPNRDKSNDGWIGDAAHAARVSQHNPDADGSVDARDITHDPSHGFDAHAFADFMQTQRDRRVRNIISNRRILAGDKGPKPWMWRSYSGSNPHTAHIHVDVLDEYQDDDTPWAMPGISQPAPHPIAKYPEIKIGSKGDYVKSVQILLLVDGIFGRRTEEAVKKFQKSKGLAADGIVGPDTWAQLEKLIDTPVAPATSKSEEWQKDIIATEFGGSDNEQTVAYSDVSAGWADRPGVALPHRFSGTRQRVEVVKGSTSVVCDIVDVGPWFPSGRGPADPYWETKTRPRAESDGRTNKAGIDLTPAAARAIGLKGKGVVNWRFIES